MEIESLPPSGPRGRCYARANRGRHCVTGIHNVWIRYDSDDAIVGEAWMEIAVDEDICLSRNISNN